MENYNGFCYPGGHETLWHASATGEAPPTRHSVAKGWQDPVGSGPGIECLGELRLPLVAGLPEERPERTAAQADPRAAAAAVLATETAAGETAPARPAGGGLPHRPLDLTTRGRSDRAPLRGCLPPLPRVEAADRPRLELPEARAASAGTGRGRHRALEANRVAPDKKNGTHLGPISSSWTKAASSSSRPSVGRGDPKARPRCSTTATATTASRSAAAWRSRPGTAGWPSTSSAAPEPLRGWISGRSCDTCSGTYGGRWSSSGIGARSTGAGKSRRSSPGILASTPTTSPPTRRNSTRPSLSGPRPIARSPMERPRTWSPCGEGCGRPSAESAVLKGSSGVASMHLTCRGEQRRFSIIYAKLNNT